MGISRPAAFHSAGQYAHSSVSVASHEPWPESAFRFAKFLPEARFRFREALMAVGSRRAHYHVTFAVLALGVAAFALLQ